MRAAQLVALAFTLSALVATGGVTASSTPAVSAASATLGATQDAHAASASKTSITTQPTATAVAPGTKARFTVAATGTHLTYRWTVRSGGSWKTVGTTRVLHTKATTRSESGTRYRVVVTGTSGKVVSSTAVLYVSRTPVVITAPTATTASAGTNGTFTVAALGAHLRYRWTVLTRGSSLWQPASSGHSATLTLTKVQAADRGDRYRVTVIGSTGRVTTKAVKLTVSKMAPVTTDASTAAANAVTAEFGDGSASYVYNVIAPDGSGTPAWRDRCAVISYAIDETNAPAGFDAIVSTALATYTSTLGLQFSQTTFDAADPYSDGVTLVFSVHAEAADSAFAAGNVVAYSGPGVVETSDNQDFATAPVFNSFVVFDAKQLATQSASILAATATHELGHTFDLAHTQDPRELMYPDISAGESSSLRSGDLAGLSRTVRSGAAC
jgi:Matrixin